MQAQDSTVLDLLSIQQGAIMHPGMNYMYGGILPLMGLNLGHSSNMCQNVAAFSETQATQARALQPPAAPLSQAGDVGHSDSFCLEWAYAMSQEEWDPAALGSMLGHNTAASMPSDEEAQSVILKEGQSNEGQQSDVNLQDASDPTNDPANPKYIRLDDQAGIPGNKRRKTDWRKYGQKSLKGKDFADADCTRCYYRCNIPGCQVRKVVEAQDPAPPVVKVIGKHNHPCGDLESGEEESGRTRGMLPIPMLDETKVNVVKSCMPNFVISDPRQADNPIIFASPGFAQMTGYNCKEVLNKNCRFLQGPDTNPHAVKQISIAVKQEKSIRIIVLNYKKDGKPFWNLLHINPIHDEDGQLVSFAGVQMDVSAMAVDESSDTVKKEDTVH